MRGELLRVVCQLTGSDPEDGGEPFSSGGRKEVKK
jgi:hypothetical protein